MSSLPPFAEQRKTKLTQQMAAEAVQLTATPCPRNDVLFLTSPNGAWAIQCPKEILPTVNPGDTILASLTIVRVLIEETSSPLAMPEKKLILPPGVN